MPCHAMPCFALPCPALPCLALPACLALPCLPAFLPCINDLVGGHRRASRLPDSIYLSIYLSVYLSIYLSIYEDTNKHAGPVSIIGRVSRLTFWCLEVQFSCVRVRASVCFVCAGPVLKVKCATFL